LNTSSSVVSSSIADWMSTSRALNMSNSQAGLIGSSLLQSSEMDMLVKDSSLQHLQQQALSRTGRFSVDFGANTLSIENVILSAQLTTTFSSTEVSTCLQPANVALRGSLSTSKQTSRHVRANSENLGILRDALDSLEQQIAGPGPSDASVGMSVSPPARCTSEPTEGLASRQEIPGATAVTLCAAKTLTPRRTRGSLAAALTAGDAAGRLVASALLECANHCM
jgi:hypothetical protein